MLGLIDPETLNNLLNLIIAKDREQLLKTIKDLQNYDAEIIIDEFINFVKDKLLDTNIDISTLDRIFNSLNSGKTLLFTGADNEFVLYLTFLKMVSEDKPQIQKIIEVRNVEKIQETPKIVKSEILKVDSYKSFFDTQIVNKIIEESPVSKNLTDEILKDCINRHIDFLDIDKDKVLIKFYFKDECKCQKLLRTRYKHIQTIVIQEFSQKYKIKFHFQPVVVKEYKDGFTPTSERPPKIVEKPKSISIEKTVQTPQPQKLETLESCLTNIKEVFNLNDSDILKLPKKKTQEVEIQDNLFGETEKIDFTFDTETNGLQGANLLSISFIISKGDKIIFRDNRYYFPEKKFDFQAQRIHGLNAEKIEKYRAGKNYPRFYKDDHLWLIETIQKYSVTNFVAHNINFDMSFMPKEIQLGVKNKKYSEFDTMIKNKDFVGILNDKGNFKNPKLIEACEKYGISFDESEAHDSKYDTDKAFELYRKTIQRLQS